MKDILLVLLIQSMFGLSLFAADPILINCIKTPEIYNLDPQPRNFNFSNNLRRKPGSPVSATGELINIVGRITDINCLPIQNAVVSIWHANSYGMSHYDEDIEEDKLDLNFAESGKFIVNNLGYYSFITVAPGKSGDRAPHVNFWFSIQIFQNSQLKCFLLTIIAIIMLILSLVILLIVDLRTF